MNSELLDAVLRAVASSLSDFAPLMLRNFAVALAPYLALYASIWGMELLLRVMHEMVVDKLHQYEDSDGYDYGTDLYEYADMMDAMQEIESDFGDVYSIFGLDMFEYAGEEPDYDDVLFHAEMAGHVSPAFDGEDYDYDQLAMYWDFDAIDE